MSNDPSLVQQLRDENNHLVAEVDRLTAEIMDLRRQITELNNENVE